MSEVMTETKATESAACSAEKPAVIIEDSAIERINILRERDGIDESVKLRIGVMGGGCSGFKYRMGFTDNISDDDHIMADCVVIDDESMQIMAGTTISYLDQLEGSKFVIDNPNVETGCGCGNSFSVK